MPHFGPPTPHPTDHISGPRRSLVLFLLNCTPLPVASTLRSSAADNPPNSILRAAWETPDSDAALLLRNTRPCAPSISNSSPRSARSRRQSALRRHPEFRPTPDSAPQGPDNPHSSSTPQ